MFFEFSFSPQNRVRSLCFWSFGRQYRRGPLINVFLRASFYVLRQRSRFNFHLKTEFVLHVFVVLVDSIGGTPGKRIP